MATSKEFAAFVSDCLLSLGEISYRPMMGEFVLYYNGIVVGGMYDDRLLLKATKSATSFLAETKEEPIYEIPYDGGKPMLAADPESERTQKLIRLIAKDLAEKKEKKRSARG